VWKHPCGGSQEQEKKKEQEEDVHAMEKVEEAENGKNVLWFEYFVCTHSVIEHQPPGAP
jgi:hypothetical protein